MAEHERASGRLDQGLRQWSAVSGVAKINASFELLVHNLLDLSHETFLHRGSIGTTEVATTPIEIEVDDEVHVVRVYRHMNAVLLANDGPRRQVRPVAGYRVLTARRLFVTRAHRGDGRATASRWRR